MLTLGGVCLVKGVENASAPEIALGSLMALGSAAVAGTAILRRSQAE